MNVFEEFINLELPIKKELQKIFSKSEPSVIFDIGACEGEDSITKLVFPEKGTWLGKINNNEKPLVNMSLDQNVIDVKVITLDGYIEKSKLRPDLIKIDTEGFDEFVIKGATATLLEYKPLVIFESDPPKRDTIFELLVKLNFEIYPLPFTGDKTEKIAKQAFIEYRLNSFIAIHKDYVFYEK